MADVAQRRIIQLVVDSRGLQADVKKSVAELENINKSVDKIKTSFMSFRDLFVAYSVFRTLGGLFNPLIEQADALVANSQRLKLVTANANELSQVQDALLVSSGNVRVAFQDLTEAYVRFAQAGESLHLSTQQQLDLNEGIALSFRVSGSTAKETQAAMIQLTQAFRSGKLAGDEFRSVAESNNELLHILADELGVNVGELKNMAAQGQVTSDVIAEGVLKNTERLRAEFELMAPTLADLKVQADSVVAILMKEVGVNSFISYFTANWSQALKEAIPLTQKYKEQILGLYEAMTGGSRVESHPLNDIFKIDPSTIDSVVVAQGTLKDLQADFNGNLQNILSQKKAISDLEAQTGGMFGIGDKALGDRILDAKDKLNEMEIYMTVVSDKIAKTQGQIDKMESIKGKPMQGPQNYEMPQDMKDRLAIPGMNHGADLGWKPSPAELAFDAAEKAAREPKKKEPKLEGWQLRLQQATGDAEKKPAELERLTEGYQNAMKAFEDYSAVVVKGLPEMDSTKETITGIGDALQTLKDKGNPFEGIEAGDPKTVQWMEDLVNASHDLTASGNPYGAMLDGTAALDASTPTVEEAKKNIVGLQVVVDQMKASGNPFEKVVQGMLDLNKGVIAVEAAKDATSGLAKVAKDLQSQGNPYADLMEGFDNINQGMLDMQNGTGTTTEAYVKMGKGIVGVLGYINDTATSLGIENATFAKAMAMAQAVVSGAMAVIQVFAEPLIPTYAKFAIAGVVAGLVGAQLAVIASQEVPQKKRYGGPVTGGKVYQVGEAGPEMFTSRTGQNYMIPGQSGSVTPNQGTKVTINNHAKVDVKAEDDGTGTLIVQIIDRASRHARNTLMQELQTGSGDFPKTLSGSYGLRRKI